MATKRDPRAIRRRYSVTAYITLETAPMARGADLRSSGEALECDQKAVPKPTLATRVQPDTVRKHQQQH